VKKLIRYFYDYIYNQNTYKILGDPGFKGARVPGAKWNVDIL
jgi:hypothetical protein